MVLFMVMVMVLGTRIVLPKAESHDYAEGSHGFRSPAAQITPVARSETVGSFLTIH